MSRYFWDAVDAGGAEVRAYEHYPLRTTTFKPFIQHMVGRAPADLGFVVGGADLPVPGIAPGTADAAEHVELGCGRDSRLQVPRDEQK